MYLKPEIPVVCREFLGFKYIFIFYFQNRAFLKKKQFPFVFVMVDREY